MGFDAQKALIVYSGVLTAVVVGFLVSGAVQGPQRASFDEIDVQRINVREPDGTLRLVVSNQARFPQIIVKGREYRHTGRDTAGMLFFNEEGTENGGLIWGGREIDGKRSSEGSLTFDRYQQDQTVQLIGSENGAARTSGLRVNDQPEAPMDFAALDRIAAMPDGPQRQAAYAAAHIGGTSRVFLGRQDDGRFGAGAAGRRREATAGPFSGPGRRREDRLSGRERAGDAHDDPGRLIAAHGNPQNPRRPRRRSEIPAPRQRRDRHADGRCRFSRLPAMGRFRC